MRRTLALVVLASLIAVPSAGATASGDYVGSTGDAVVLCGIGDHEIAKAAGICLGGRTFAVPQTPRLTSVKITIDDRLGSDTAGFYQFQDGSGNPRAAGEFCGSTTANVPSAATKLSVFVSQARAVPDCVSVLAVGTLGEISVDWRPPP